MIKLKKQYAFISYLTKNQAFADSLNMSFEKNNIQMWMAPYDIEAGKNYAQVINDAIESCTCFVLVLSEASQKSQYVVRELERAISYNKPIIPLKIEELELNSSFKFYIGINQVISIPQFSSNIVDFSKVLSVVKKLTAVENAGKVEHSISALDYEKVGGIYKTMERQEKALADYDEYLKRREEALKKLQTLRSKRDLGIAYIKVGDTYEATGRLEEALAAYEKNLELSEEVCKELQTAGSKRDLGIAYSKVGGIYEGTGRVEEAEKIYEQMISLMREVAAELGTKDSYIELSYC